MIAASEPLEFIPRGRQAVEDQPGSAEVIQKPVLTSENVLLQRLQDVNISAREDDSETWSLREIYEPIQMRDQSLRNCTTKTTQQYDNYMRAFHVNSEEELYVKKNHLIWSKGSIEYNPVHQLCLTVETPIKFAFFIDKSFVNSKHKEAKNNVPEDKELTVICIIEQNSLRVYAEDGTDFITNLEFPISNVWTTRFGILFEKAPANTIIQSHTISMPRLFSLSHPLDEVSPVLSKTATNVVNYLTDADCNIIYSDSNSNLFLQYDNKLCKHFISKIRKATDAEVQVVCSQNESGIGSTHHSMNRGSFSHNSMKFCNKHDTPKNQSSNLGGSFGPHSGYSAHISKFLSSPHTMTGSLPGLHRNSPVGHLSHLQSTIGQHSISSQDIRKMGQAQPSKPIVPEYCLEHIWTENTYGNSRDFGEISSRAFIHFDLVGQAYLCYLLPRSHKLHLVCINNYGGEDLDISKIPLLIPAKEALPLNRMKMIAVLDTAGCLVLYTGSIVVSKVHVAAAMMPPHPLSNLSGSNPSPKTPSSPFPRRSSLLPTAQKASDNIFEDELHLLSPVQPLQSHVNNRNNAWISMRDPACNRLTLVYPNGKMYRISLPLITDNIFIARCIHALRQILTRPQFLHMMTHWYRARNPPGARDYSTNTEWLVFKNNLLTLMGLSVSNKDSGNGSFGSFPAQEPKRKKNDSIESSSDEGYKFYLAFKKSRGIDLEQPIEPCKNVDTNAILFTSMASIFYGFHLLYEDFKLDNCYHSYMQYLAEFLHQLALDMQLSTYVFHYTLDYPPLLKKTVKSSLLTEQHGAMMVHKELLQMPARGIYAQVEHILKDSSGVQPFVYVEGINSLSRNVLQLTSLIMHGHEKMKRWVQPFEFEESVQSSYPKRPKRFISSDVSRPEQVIQMLIQMDMTRSDIQRLPVALHLIIAECLEYARLEPPLGCSPATYELVLRSELIEHAKIQADTFQFLNQPVVGVDDSLTPRLLPSVNECTTSETSSDDGMANIDTKLLSLRFPEDMRITEVRRLLASSEPVSIDVTQQPGVTDHEFIEEQEKQLFALCTRTMTLPMGRGMFTLRTLNPEPTESMPIPKLCLSGREPVKGASVEMQTIEFPANMNLWPTFHNGVAAGLQISPFAKDVDSTWIVYNKPKNAGETTTDHAGFLMALGLNGHLKTLSFMSIYDYLVKCDEMTSVGLLLGISATHRGTMNNTTTKLLSVHIEALLPATALELDIPQNIQVACLMGIGLLYQGTAKRHIAEVLLQEVGRPPGPEMENSFERESYSLTAGLSLGLVTLGQGESPAGLRDLQLPDTLHYYMVGGNKRQLTGSQKEKYKLPSFQVREGGNVNIDVTAPGATLALGLMFFNTNNRAVAEWMDPPNTKYLLDLVRPDLLLLRTISRGLILWADIKPSEEYLSKQFPRNLQIEMERGMANEAEDIDHEAICQAYCNIIAGASFCMGLKYAGTENEDALDVLYATIKQFMGFPGKYVGEHAGRTTVENCLCLVLIGASLVFAGSGNLKILRVIRFLRSRIGNQNPQVTYGSHMAIHMSLGLLFLGAGRFTIAKTPEAVAALVCAFFPKFPINSNDNRYHLQAFRHLYVLAVEPRLLLPRDIDTKKLCLCYVSVLEIGSKEWRRLPMAPCILPELSTLQKVKIDDPNYWPVCFEKGRNWKQLVKTLENSACVDIKRRSGCLSHMDDPDRLKSLFTQTLTSEQYLCWDIDPEALDRFASETYVTAFTERFLKYRDSLVRTDELIKKQKLKLLFYNAVVKDKMHVLQIYLSIYDNLVCAKRQPKLGQIWQMKLIDNYIANYKQSHVLFSKELVQSLVEEFNMFIQQSRDDLSQQLRRFIASPTFEANIVDNLTITDVARLVAVISYYGLTPNLLNMVDLSGTRNLLRYLYEFQKLKLDSNTIYCLVKIMQKTGD